MKRLFFAIGLSCCFVTTSSAFWWGNDKPWFWPWWNPSVIEERRQKPEISDENMKKTDNRMLLVLSAPSVHSQYYAPAFEEIVDFHVGYIGQVLAAGLDDVRLIVDRDTAKYYRDRVPSDVLIVDEISDIWMRDFTLVNPSDPVGFVYTNASMSWEESEEVQESFRVFARRHGLQFAQTDWLLDGGNLVDNYAGKVVTTTRFLEDNDLTYRQGVRELKRLLGATQVAIIEPDEEVLAHSDGMVSWIDEDVLLVNDYSSDPEFRDMVLGELRYAFPDTTIIEVPVTYHENKPGEWEGFASACGVNLNSTVTHDAVYVPTFGMSHEKEVLKIIRNNTNKKVVEIDARGVCRMGGSVRCLTLQLDGKNRKQILED